MKEFGRHFIQRLAHSAKFRLDQGLALLSGQKIIQDYQKESPFLIKHTIVTPEYLGRHPETPFDAQISRKELTELTGEGLSEGILAIVPIPVRSKSSTPSRRLLWCAGVKDPRNLGGLFRSASAFGFKVYLDEACSDIYTLEAIRCARARHLIDADLVIDRGISIDGARCQFVAAELPQKIEGCFTWGPFISSSAKPISMEEDPICVVVGNESRGLKDCTLKPDVFLGIRTHTQHSLNVSMAASILMHHFWANEPS